MSLESVVGNISLRLPLRTVRDDLAVDVFPDESLESPVRVLVVRVTRISVPVRVGEGNIAGESKSHPGQMLCLQIRKKEMMNDNWVE